MKDSQPTIQGAMVAYKYIKADNERFSTVAIRGDATS